MSLLGLDIGTSGCKATIIGYDGIAKTKAYQSYKLSCPRYGWEELNPETVWNATKKVMFEVLDDYNGEPINAISVSSFGEAAIPIDEKGNVLNNSIIYIDVRGKEEAQYLREKLGHEKILNITGASIHPMYSIAKIMWLKKHMAETYDRTWKFLMFADFILFKLGAMPHTDYSLAARTMAFDIVGKKWSREIFDSAQIDEDKFASPVQAGTAVGKISRSIASEFCLPPNVILAAGGHDQACAALGAGVIKSNIAVDGLGTTECITPTFEKPIISKEMAKNGFACVPHVIPDMYVTYAFTFTSGSILTWFRNNFGSIYSNQISHNDANIYDLIISKATAKPSDIFILPHFAGAATPYMDTNARGAIVGLTIETSPEDITKAILEGITFEIMVNIEKLKEAGIKIEEVRAVGGLSRHNSFLQLKADMMGIKVNSMNVSEAGTLGVAILAAIASGLYPNIEEAVKKTVKINKEYYPDVKLNDIYMKKFQKYKRIYPAVKSIL